MVMVNSVTLFSFSHNLHSSVDTERRAVPLQHLNMSCALLQEFTAARYIRLRMQRIRTLNADLMMAIAEDPRYLDPTVTNRVSKTQHHSANVHAVKK